MDYLKVCTLIRKLFFAFDNDTSKSLDKDELKVLIDMLIEEHEILN